MTTSTINNAQTMAPGGGALLAGRYRIVRQLGQGGMGSVWLAEDTQLDNKPFAIKMLPSILVSNKRAYRQLKDEALVAMKLTHPNIVTLRAFEENNGNPFLVMDYIDGETLDDYLAEHCVATAPSPSSLGGIPEADVIRILKPIAAALDYAHGEGVVHRDVKPANVMIRKDGHPFILDFGIAREIQETLTRVTGKLSSGTLLYMSPEQLNGEMPKPAQDIYSFAAMAYECLKGEPPFVRGQIEHQILNVQPEPPVGASAPLARAVMVGLAKKPEDRPKNCSAVLEARNSVAEPKKAASGISIHKEDRRHLPPGVRPSMIDGNDSAKKSSAQRPMPSRIPIEAKRETGVLNWGTVGALVAFILVAVGVGGKLYNDNLSKASATPVVDGSLPTSPVPTMPPVQPPVQPPKPQPQPAGTTKADVDGIYVKATEAMANVRAIKQDDDGFDARKRECEKAYGQAEARYKVGHWEESARLFTDVVDLCGKTVQLDDEWRMMREKLKDAKNSGEKAKKVGAAAWSAQRWNVANGWMKQGGEKLSYGDFAAAARAFAEARREYDLSAQETRERVASERQAAAERQRRAKWRKTGEQFTINEPYGLNLTMKWCPAGTFMMGSPPSEEGRSDIEVQHQVTLAKGFWMGETEVTQGQWKKLMDGETVVDLARKGLQDDTVFKIDGKQQTLREFWGKDRYADPKTRCGDLDDDVPVYNVNWHEAVEFCRRLTKREREAGRVPDGYEYRLPTEAEWEYACRADTTTALPNGRDIRILGKYNAPALDDIAWYGGNSSVGFGNGRGIDTHSLSEVQYPGGRAFARKVERKQPNNWGMYDMIGNVCEWCGDWAGGYGYGSQTDPTGPSSGVCRVHRGGAWNYYARSCRSAIRTWGPPDFRSYYLGFRVALARKLEGEYSAGAEPLSKQNSGQRVGMTDANQRWERRDDGIDSLLRDLDTATAKRETPSRMQVEVPKRIYTYEARFVPYILEGGTKKYVPAEANSDITNGMFVRREVRDGKYEVVLGTNSLPDGLLRLGLIYGRNSAKEWISSSMFNGQAKEVQLK